MKLQLFFASLTGAVLLMGCAGTVPTPPAQIKLTPPTRALAFQEKPTQDFGTIVVTRDTGYSGSACYFALHINGKLAARLDMGERATFFVLPGEHLLRASRDAQGGGLCAVGIDGSFTQRETTLRANETKYFRYLIGEGGLDIQRSDP